MTRDFNDTGLCVRRLHYMVDTSPQIKKTFEKFIERGKYFTINRGRQFGKTTTISLLRNFLLKRDDYLVIRTSFEGVGDNIYENEETFSRGFLRRLYSKTRLNDKRRAEIFKEASKKMNDFENLSDFITDFVVKEQKKVVLIIDEVDKSSNNQLFLNFLGMLRDKYLLRNDDEDYTFHSVVLAGVHDIKTIKLKLRPNEESQLNSPWNIAADFDIDLSFHPPQIVTLLEDYLSEHPDVNIPVKEVAEKLYYYTSGYPYLVSKLCKIADEKIIEKRKDKNWTVEDIEAAYRFITATDYQTTLFDSMFKNLIGYEELHENTKLMVMGGKTFNYNVYDPVVKFGTIHSIFKKKKDNCVIHNRIFEQRFFDYFTARTTRENILKQPDPPENFYMDDELYLDIVLLKFQEFMKENYSHTDRNFIEREGRLIFLSFMKSIINGKGYTFKEPTTAYEQRADIVITFIKKLYVLELKIWRGEIYHQKGLQQLSDYLDTYSLKKGYLLIFNFNKKKEFMKKNIKFKDKEIFAVWT